MTFTLRSTAALVLIPETLAMVTVASDTMALGALRDVALTEATGRVGIGRVPARLATVGETEATGVVTVVTGGVTVTPGLLLMVAMVLAVATPV